MDDPHDATWIPPTKRIVWCPVHQEDMETCECGRNGGNVLATLVIIAVTILIVVGIFAALMAIFL